MAYSKFKPLDIENIENKPQKLKEDFISHFLNEDLGEKNHLIDFLNLYLKDKQLKIYLILKAKIFEKIECLNMIFFICICFDF